MASPQTENGYTKVSNELLEAFCKKGLPQNAGQIWWFILRKTYGWKKKNDLISFGQIEAGTNISKAHISRELTRLVKANMIVTQTGNTRSVTYGIQKDYEEWGELPKRVTVAQMGSVVAQMGSEQAQMGNQKTSKGLPDKGLPTPKENITKETITKDICEVKKQTSQESDIFNFWKDTMEHPKAKLSSDRRQKIKARLKEGFTVDDCKEAIQNCRDSPYHQGDNEQGKVYDSIGLIFRNADKLEWFINMHNKASPRQNSVSIDDILERRNNGGTI